MDDSSAFIKNHSLYPKIVSEVHPRDFEYIKEVLRDYEFDLKPSYGFFEIQDFDQISKKAIDMFFLNLEKVGFSQLDSESIRYAWSQVRHSFLKNYWGFKKFEVKPQNYRSPKSYNFEKIPNKDLPVKAKKPINYKDAFFYIWSVIQSLVIMKSLILIFGNELAKDDTIQNRILFGSIIIASFGSLFLFAWLRRKQK